jgi:hypothetical protein
MIEKIYIKNRFNNIINNREMNNQNKSIKQSKNKYKPLIMDENDKYIFEQIPLIGRTKFPSGAYKKHKEGNLKGQYVSKELWITDTWEQRDCNYGTPTGKDAGMWVLDIDMFCKEKKRFLEKEEHPFFKAFPDFEYDTLTIKSPNKGYHFYYQYEPENPITSVVDNDLRTDTRGNGGFIVSPYSAVKSYDGKVRQYKPINDLPINKCSDELMKWVNEKIIKNKKNKSTPKKINKINMDNVEKDDNEYDGLDLTKYNFNINEEELMKICEGLPTRYFTNYNDWLVFTTGMKTLWEAMGEASWVVDIWDDLSQSNAEEHYDYDKNNEMWDGITAHKVLKCVFKIFCDSKYEHAYQLLTYRTFKPELKNNVKPDMIINREKENGKLGYDFFKEQKVGKDIDCVIVKSDTGTGKTTSTKHFLDGKRFVSLVSRVSLGEEQYTIFNEHGLDCVFYDYLDDQYRGENIVIQVDSIGMLGQQLYYGGFEDYYVYIDEFNSLVEYLCRSPTLAKYRVRVFEQLIELISDCKGMIGTDADISDISLKLLQFTTKTPVYIQNTYKHNKGIKANEIINYNDFMKEITQEEKFLCCCDSKTQAEIIYNKCKSAGMNDVVLITSITNNYVRFDEHNRIIYSPKIIYGIDSVMKRPVYCFYKEHTISPRAMVQQIARCRNITEIKFHFDKKQIKEYSFDNVDEAEQYLLSVDKEIKTLHYQKSSEVTFRQFLELYSRFLYNEDAHNTNKFGHFIHLARERGIIVNETLENEDRKKSTYKKDKDNNKKLQIKNFDPTTSSAQKLNEVLKIPDSEIKQYAVIFVEPWRAEYHFNLIDYLCKDDEDVRREICGDEDGMGGLNDFTIEQIKNRSFKIDLFNRVRNMVFGENYNKRLLEMNPPNKKNKNIPRQYRDKVHKELSKKDLIQIVKLNAMANNINAENITDCKEESFTETTQDVLNLLANSIFPEEVFDVERRNVKKLDENGNIMRGEPDEKNKKGKILYDKEDYPVLVTKKITDHKHLAWFRQNNRGEELPDITEYDDEVRAVVNEALDLEDNSGINIPDYCLID